MVSKTLPTYKMGHEIIDFIPPILKNVLINVSPLS